MFNMNYSLVATLNGSLVSKIDVLGTSMLFLKIFQILAVFNYDDMIVEDLADEWDSAYLPELYRKSKVVAKYQTSAGEIAIAVNTTGVSDVYTDVDMSVDVWGKTFDGAPHDVFKEMARHNPVAAATMFHHLIAYNLVNDAESSIDGTEFDMVFSDGVTCVKINHIKFD